MSIARASQRLLPPAAFTAEERLAIVVLVGSTVVAMLFPFPLTKSVLGGVVGLTFLYVSLRAFYLGVAFFTFLLPLQTLVENQSLLLRGINLQTAFVLFFIFVAVISGKSEPEETAKGTITNPLVLPMAGLLVTVILSAFHAYAVHQTELVDQLSRVKNWFSYSIFVVLAFKYIQKPRQKLGN